MDPRKCTSSVGVPSLNTATPSRFSIKWAEKNQRGNVEKASCSSSNSESEVDVDLREVYFLLLHILSSGPCKRAFSHLSDELLEHQLLPRRYHSWFSRDGGDKGISFPLTYAELAERYPHIEKDHLVKLLKQLMTATTSSSGLGKVGRPSPNAADVPTLLGTGSFSLLDRDKNVENKEAKPPPAYLHWPHMQAGQIRALALREIGGGFTKHHRAPSTRSACFAIAKPSTLLEKMQNIKKLRGHRNAVYCAIFDRSGRYVITGSDDRLVKVWSMETALCLASCRGHEGDITDLAVSSNNAVVASASNDFVIRVWRLPDGMPVSVLQGHTGAVTAIAFSPRPNAVYQLLSSSDDGTCRIWEVRFSQLKPKIYQPKPLDAITAKSNATSNNGALLTSGSQNHQILCCAFNADGAVFVTGSSDTYARVWNALKSNTDELPMHEMDVLAGHEDDVNYVQFSGCPVASKPPLSDSLKEESFPKFKNSWFCHDNIVTCSRDGSAIIWIPRSRRSHGKVGRWTRAYHLKVPPPPLPPQPARGGPRQRFLPTPRGVNMIVWSLDNRFVLAAIMDCRICVWNAVDGSLVHSLTGHTASSYVLDVHPFNPRIAMSAGYDGKTIVWDVWEGTPIRTYAMGDFKLVDGKFSADGTSIVVSDDAGQIYLINTGEGELQKDAKYDQFFLGDYRPVVRDTSGGVLDQETQLPSHQRNIQDPLCDSTMMPYPEPYQTAYQRRRLGALGIEWQPSMTKFAIGPDFNLGIDYLMPPLPDLERIIEPLPDFVLDAAFWEPVNEVLSEDSDSEYNVAEENSSEAEKERSVPSSTSDDSEFSAEDGNKDNLRRSRRKKHKFESVASSGRRVKKRYLDESAGTSSTSYKNKKTKTGRRVSKRKSSKPTTSRPKRLAASNARNMLSQISGTSSEVEEDEEEEFESECDSSDGDLVILEDSDHEGSDHGIVRHKCERKDGPSSNELLLEETPNPSQLSESQNTLNKRKFVLKFSLRDTKPKCEDGELVSVTSSSAPQKIAREKNIMKISVGSPSTPTFESNDEEQLKELYENKKENGDVEQPMSSSWGGVKLRTCRYLRSEDVLQMASPSLDGKQFGANELEHSDVDVKNERDSHNHILEPSPPQDVKLKCKEKGPSVNEVDHANDSSEKQHAPQTLPRIRIKKARILTDPVNPPKLKFVSSSKEPNPEDKATLKSPPNLEGNHLFSEVAGASSDFPGTVTDVMRSTRSLSIKASSQEENVVNHNCSVKRGKYQTEGTSRDVEEPGRRSRSARTQRGQNSYYDQGSSSQRAVSLPVGKLSWLTLSQHEDCYRYIPQLGDEVVYLIQGHQAFSEESGSREFPPRSLKENLNAVEVCNVESLDYTCGRGSGESCCKIRLKFIDPSSNVFGNSFTLTLPELKDFSDFVVERSLYDAAINRNWTTRDTCYVWWRNQYKEGGEWWYGRVMSAQAKSPEFPDSPWMRFQVRYKGPSGETEEHNPWELCDNPYQNPWDRPRIDPQARDKLLHYFSKLEDKEFDIIQQMNQAVQKTEYSNRYPAPLYPELIKERLKNEYYRSLESAKNDISIMFSNYERYFTRKEPADKISYISAWLAKRLSRL